MKGLLLRILPKGLSDRLRGTWMVLRYRARVARKKRTGPSFSEFTAKVPAEQPSVTVYITNSNNRSPLELTLRTLFEHTEYSNFEVVVADNNSTDGSIEMVESIMKDNPVRLLSGVSRPQHEWYDHFFRTNSTDYWVGIHEDMVFLSGDWLAELIGYMEAYPETDLLGGEYFPEVHDVPEPVSGTVVTMRESLSTWIFCVRTTLRDHVSTSFEFYRYEDEESGKLIVFDQGGWLMKNMRDNGRTFAVMPDWYVQKWEHLSNITWAFKYDMDPAVRMLKLHQIRDTDRRLKRL
ncbi:MAG: glycosyltransferase [Rhodothermales bacterium]|nr:glycosyltransferase [Rhodothermales bacterium]